MGTTISIMLPATTEQPASDRSGDEKRPTDGNGETILVVEDEPALREVTERMLHAAGFTSSPPRTGPTALRFAASHQGAIHLLLTDVGCRTCSARSWPSAWSPVRPETRVLYTSGYAQPVLTSQGTLAHDINLLEKPFTKTELLNSVRQRLTQS
jgi:two-component system cell cycle sensor histidine kinase/response regulator CckA